MPIDPAFIKLLEAALDCEIGIKVPSHNGASLRVLLYRARETDPRFDAVRITNSPTDPNEVWIIKKTHYTPSHGPYAREIDEEE